MKPCSLSNEVLNDAANFTSQFKIGYRSRDAYRSNDAVRKIALDSDVLALIDYIHDESAFPFQTLNFRFGTQQPTHSDVVHFDTLPQRGFKFKLLFIYNAITR